MGKVTAVHDGSSVKEIFVSPTALESGPEEVLIILEGVNQVIGESQVPSKQVYLGPDPNPNPAQTAVPSATIETTADKVMDKYKQIGEQQGHKYGVNPPGSRPIDFNVKLNPEASKPAPTASQGEAGQVRTAPVPATAGGAPAGSRPPVPAPAVTPAVPSNSPPQR